MKLVAKNGESLHVTLNLWGAWRLLTELDADVLNASDSRGGVYDRYVSDPFFRADFLSVLIETGTRWEVSSDRAVMFIENTQADSADSLSREVRLFLPDPDDLVRGQSDRKPEPYNAHEIWKAVFRLAGGCGVDWRGLTMRQLWYMADGKERGAWSMTSAVMALIANCNRDPKAHPRPFSPDEFSPFGKPANRQRKAIPHSDKSMKTLGGMFDKMFSKR